MGERVLGTENLLVRRELDDPDARRDHERSLLDEERLGQGGHEAGGHEGRVGRTLQQHRELVAAQPGHEVAGPHDALEALRREREDLVPGGVTEGVVHGLDLVEVDQQHGG